MQTWGTSGTCGRCLLGRRAELETAAHDGVKPGRGRIRSMTECRSSRLTFRSETQSVIAHDVGYVTGNCKSRSLVTVGLSPPGFDRPRCIAPHCLRLCFKRLGSIRALIEREGEGL
jgi:hypothetical protein